MTRASPVLPLREWYVISLRPLGQHGGVRSAAAKVGASVFALSTLRLEMIDAKKSLAQALTCARVIATSPAAVRYAHAQQPLRQRRGQCWFALGQTTAAALHRRGIGEVEIPVNASDSEALLEHPGLAQVRRQRIGLITAPGGRGLLSKQLRERGAVLCTSLVYRRVAIRPASARLHKMAALPASSALLVSSGEALAGLWETLDHDDDARHLLAQRPCVVSSARLDHLAQALGFSDRLRADSAQPASLLAALVKHVKHPRFR